MRIAIGLVLIVLLGAGIYLGMNYRVERHYENGQFSYLKITPRSAGGEGVDSGGGTVAEPAARPLRPTFRIAAFNLDGLDENKLAAFRIHDVLGRLLPQFELIALQGVRGKNQGMLVRLVELINSDGRHYQFVTSPAQRRDGIEHYSAFLFDQTALEIDRRTVHFVEDSFRRFRHQPLTASFRVRGVEPGAAFTFTLVSVETDPQNAAEENDLLADVYRAVRNDGRNEDDVIMLGDFEADESHLGRLGNILGMTAAISGMPSTTQGTRLLDNLVFDRRATSEFTGKAEVFDLMRRFDLSVEGAAEISRHLPVWAEFSVYEGGQQGFVPPGGK
ncbi:MAG: endonuclease/exonuclease/phosphatase [Pirellulales bacterium]|nr:endonuclease/exonuclease/phosphatase [Pirellulales bacterium]